MLKLAAAVSAIACIAVVACGGQAGPDGPAASLELTRDFGQETLADEDVALAGRGTILRLLKSDHEVSGDPDLGITVAAIDGLAQRIEPIAGSDPKWDAESKELREQGRDPSTSTWVFFVNGLKTDPPPEDFKLYPGDVVQGDLRDWDTSASVRATVGAFPQPFTGGMYGDRFPTRVRCAKPGSQPCRTVRKTLLDAGVRLDGPPPKTRGKVGRYQLRRAEVFVGTWREIRDRPSIKSLPEGLAYARVFPQFTRDGDALQLLDWEQRPVRTEGAGTGFLAAMKPDEENLVWVVTGVDDEGVARAADAFGSDDVRGAYAVAVTGDGVERLPLEPQRFADGD